MSVVRLLATTVAIAFLIAACVYLKAASAGPDPSPGVTARPVIVKTDYVCAFTMRRVKPLDGAHDWWESGALRWCRYVGRKP